MSSLQYQIPQNGQSYYNNTLYGITGFQLRSNVSLGISTLISLNWQLEIDLVSSLESLSVDYLLIMLPPCYGCSGKPYLNSNECVAQCALGVEPSRGVCLKCP
jgi:hypothetical protein